MKTSNEQIPFCATHPGTLIKDELKARKIKRKDFALELGVSQVFLNNIINGRLPVLPDFAKKLEKALAIPADYWIRFQIQFENDKLKSEISRKNKNKR